MLFCSRTYESRAEEVRRFCGEKCYLEALCRAQLYPDEEKIPIPPIPEPVIPIPSIFPDEHRILTMTIKIRTEYEAMWVKMSCFEKVERFVTFVG